MASLIQTVSVERPSRGGEMEMSSKIQKWILEAMQHSFEAGKHHNRQANISEV